MLFKRMSTASSPTGVDGPLHLSSPETRPNPTSSSKRTTLQWLDRRKSLPRLSISQPRPIEASPVPLLPPAGLPRQRESWLYEQQVPRPASRKKRVVPRRSSTGGSISNPILCPPSPALSAISRETLDRDLPSYPYISTMLSPLPPSPRNASHPSAASAPRTHNIKRKPVPYHLAAGHKLEVNGEDYQYRQKAAEFAAAPTDAFEARRELAELRTNIGSPESFPTSPELESVGYEEVDSKITLFSLHVEGESADPSGTFASDDSDPEPCALDSILDLYPSQDPSSGDESCPSLDSSNHSSPGASSDTLTLQDFADSLDDDHLEPNRRRSSVFDCRKDRRTSTFSISSSIYTPTRVQAFGKTFFLTPKSDGASESNLSLVSDDSEGDILVIRMGV